MLPYIPACLQKQASDEKGLALVIVLWIAVILSGITSAGAYLARLELRQSYYPAREMQLVGACMSGIEKVKVEIYNDTNRYDSLKESWISGFKDVINVEDVEVTVVVRDEESKLNLNTAQAESLKKLIVFSDSSNCDEMIDSLIDWRDTDSTALPSGAEQEYYSALSPKRYCRNSNLYCMEELGLIKGFGDQKTVAALKDYATVDSNGKININTAPVEVLTTLPKVDYLMAQNIIAKRSGSDLEIGTEDDTPFTQISELREVVGNDVYKEINGLIAVKSHNFKVRVIASYGKYTKLVEALLSRQGRNITMKYWREL